MIAEVIIPALRQPERLLASLARQTRPADRITIVSNEAEPTPGARVIRFRSEAYCYGEADVVLRRNIGIWSSDADLLIFQDDDQVAPANMIEAAEARLTEADFVWGHHRFIDFDRYTTDELLALPPAAGQEREHPPNSFHGHWSCYAGMFGARRHVLQDMGGFDMFFLGRHGNEDQNLGLRSLVRANQAKVFIYEPPFAWHPLISPTRPAGVQTNSCGAHEGDVVEIEGFSFFQCRRCPFRKADAPVFANHVVMAYDPSLVQTREETV